MREAAKPLGVIVKTTAQPAPLRDRLRYWPQALLPQPLEGIRVEAFRPGHLAHQQEHAENRHICLALST